MKRSLLIVTVAAAALLISSPPAAGDANVKSKKKRKGSGTTTHEVESGQTLWTISRAYGCSLQQVTRANDLTDSSIIRPGQKLRIPSCGNGRRSKRRRAAAASSPRIKHVVVSGDTLSAIAKQYDTSIDAIRSRNRIDGSLIRPGQELVVVPGKDGRGRPVIGQSRGSAGHGRLINGVQLPRSRNYYRRRAYRAWGATHTIHHIKRMAAVVSDRYRVHKVAIGDISSKKGGHISPHVSHQSGRDVDIGFYFKKKPSGYPTSFVVGTKRNLHMKANWLMLKTLYQTRDQAGGVEKIFLDWHLQKLFYDWARKQGVSKRMLADMFQYPNGRGSKRGIIRDESGHDDHIHVRFKCPPRDDKCR